MKLSDFLFNIGRPVAFYPGLVKALGSMKQAVFVCQMAYWKDKGSDPEGWIFKTAEEIEQETSLTYKEQITVRAALVEKKALQEKYARTEHQMYFRVDWDVVNTIWEEHLTNGHMPNGQVASDQRSGGTLPKVSSLNGISENTAKTTTKKGDLVDGMLAFGKQAAVNLEALTAFEKAFGFGTLPWESNSTWTKFQKFIVRIYAADPDVFSDYVAWRAGDGKYTAFSNRKIRENPQAFMDTGYPEFEASKMYSGKPAPSQPQLTDAQLAAAREDARRQFGVSS